MKNKLCCFTVNTTHACIIANNYISNNLDNVKIIYINEKNETKKLTHKRRRLWQSNFMNKQEHSIFTTKM